MRLQIPLFRSIFKTEFERIHVQHFTELINHRLSRELRIGSAGSPIGGRFGLVDHDIIHVDCGVLDVIRSENADSTAGHHRPREGTGFVDQVCFGCGDAAVRRDAHLQFHV